MTHAGGIVLSVTIVGTSLPGGPIRRSGARPGDLIAVTGALGGSKHGRHLRFEPRLLESRLLLELGPPSAMIDVSDGLLLDLFRVADASGTGFRVDVEQVPIHPDTHLDGGDALAEALGGGEDFELLLMAPATTMERILARWTSETPISVIGEIVEDGRWLSRGGHLEPASAMGYAHE